MILFAIELNGQVYVFGDDKKLLFSASGALYSYSTHYVAIQTAEAPKQIQIYDKDKCLIGTYPQDLLDMSNIIGIVL